MILLIDNYDSFSYNLFQLVGEMAPDVRVIRNDELTVEEIKSLKPDRIILSPGPGRPEDAGVIMEVAKVLGRDIPILGVCLGHQAICAAFGATVTYAKELMHGKQSDVEFVTESPLFMGCPKSAPVARYPNSSSAPRMVAKVRPLSCDRRPGTFSSNKKGGLLTAAIRAISKKRVPLVSSWNPLRSPAILKD